jgi:hypothetical protein
MASAATAALTSASAASATYATGTLAAPSTLSASHGPCTVAVAPSVKLNWTATASTWADGYEIRRSLVSGGPYTPVGIVSGLGTTTYTDGSVLFSLTYYYVVRATKAAWRSADTNQASLTTKTVLCA